MKYLKKSLFFFLLSLFFPQIGGAEVFLNTKKEPKIILFDAPEKEKVKVEKQETLKELDKKELTKKVKTEIQDVNKSIAVEKPTLQNVENRVVPQKIQSSSKIEPIALVYASAMVGKYGIDAHNVSVAYFLEKGTDFSLEMFDIEKEDKNSIFALLDSFADKKITKIVFLLTDKNVWILNNYPNINQFEFYLPLVHKSNVAYPKSNFIYGGIDYKEQFALLFKKNNTNFIEIYDESPLSTTLHNELLKLDISNLTSLQIKGKVPDYSPLFAKKSEINKSVVVLNTSIVKSAIIISMLRAKGIVPKEILSTQANYSPTAFQLLQEEDKKHFFTVNSIGKLPEKLAGTVDFLGNDIDYNWVNYSVILGLEYLTTKGKSLLNQVQIKENQVTYMPKIFGIDEGRFVEVKR